MLSGQRALITGAAGGMGRALADALAGQRVDLLLTGRDLRRLGELCEALRARHPEVSIDSLELDLAQPDVALPAGEFDLLVLCAGEFDGRAVLDTPAEDFERLLRVNAVAPLHLCQHLLPALTRRQGQIVFINSSAAAQPPRAVPGAYAASKAAAAVVAGALRDAVNASGVRVLSVFPGRTATPMQERLFAAEQRDYQPERLLQPEDVASVVLNALQLPRTAEITDIHVRPFLKS